MGRMTQLHRIGLAIATTVFAGVVAAPLLRFAGAHQPADFLYGLFAHVCHQDPCRSVAMLTHDLAVCGRCTGLYLGLLLAFVALRFVPNSERSWMPAVALVVAPTWMAADVGLAWLGWHDPTLLTRVSSGLLLGAGIAVALARAGSSRLASGLGLQIGALVLLAIPLIACKKPVKPGEAPPAAAAPEAPAVEGGAAPAGVPTSPGCTRDTDCKGERVCVDGACVDREVPIIVKLPEGGCRRDTDCKGQRVCVEGECRDPVSPPTTVVEVKPTTRCEDCPGRCLAVQQLCNQGSVRDCFRAGACMCTCKKDAGGCGSTLEELNHCIETNRAKAED